MKKLITILIILTCLELSARIYWCVKYKNLSAFKYITLKRQKRLKPKWNYTTFYKVHRHTPGTHQQDSPFGKIDYSVNSLGFRDKELTSKRPRICALGASTTFGLFVNDDETYPHYLEQMIDGEVINCGFSGEKMKFIYELFREIVENGIIRPDMIIVYSAFNDAYTPPLTFENKIAKINNIIYYRSIFYTLLIEKYSFIRYHNPIPSFLYSLPPEIPQEYIRYLKKVVSLAKQNNIEILLVKQSMRTKRIEGTLEELEKLYKEKPADFYRIAQSYYVKQMDTLGVATLDTDISKEYFIDKIHMNAEGNKRLAEIISERLKDKQ